MRHGTTTCLQINNFLVFRAVCLLVASSSRDARIILAHHQPDISLSSGLHTAYGLSNTTCRNICLSKGAFGDVTIVPLVHTVTVLAEFSYPDRNLYTTTRVYPKLFSQTTTVRNPSLPTNEAQGTSKHFVWNRFPIPYVN